MRILTKGNRRARERKGKRVRDVQNPEGEGSNSESFQLLPPVSLSRK